MKKRLIIIVCVAFASFTWQAGVQEAVAQEAVAQISAEDDLGYGTHLFERGRYDLSILELERYIYSHPQDLHTPYAGLLLALSYANESQYDEAFSLLDGLERAISGSPWEDRYSGILCEAGFHRLSLLFRQKKTSEFELEKERVATICREPDERMGRYTDAMTVALEIYEMQWRRALSELQSTRYLSEGLTERLTAELEEALRNRDKSPALGGVLSVVPGMGHLYAGRAWDGFKSLLVNATFITLSAVCFTNDLPVPGGIFAGVEGVLYIANIYGGVNAVLQENARQALMRRDRMLKLLPAPPLRVISITEEFDIE
jgi:tetratricopeptide (TPR) repeat protein